MTRSIGAGVPGGIGPVESTRHVVFDFVEGQFFEFNSIGFSITPSARIAGEVFNSNYSARSLVGPSFNFGFFMGLGLEGSIGLGQGAGRAAFGSIGVQLGGVLGVSNVWSDEISGIQAFRDPLFSGLFVNAKFRADWAANGITYTDDDLGFATLGPGHSGWNDGRTPAGLRDDYGIGNYGEFGNIDNGPIGGFNHTGNGAFDHSPTDFDSFTAASIANPNNPNAGGYSTNTDGLPGSTDPNGNGNFGPTGGDGGGGLGGFGPDPFGAGSANSMGPDTYGGGWGGSDNATTGGFNDTGNGAVDHSPTDFDSFAGERGYGGGTNIGGTAADTDPDGNGNFGGTSSSGGDTSGAGSGKPIVLDLDGDGIEVALGATSPAFFDFDNDGFREQTAWVGADDALLVIDLAANNNEPFVAENIIACARAV